MKQIMTVIWYALIPALGLVYAIGCSTSPSGGNVNPNYTIDLSIDPDTLANEQPGTVSCFLRDLYGEIYIGGNLKFSALSPESDVTSSATSDTTETGLDAPVYYIPHDVDTTFDVIYAAFTVDNTPAADTITWDSTIVYILQP